MATAAETENSNNTPKTRNRTAAAKTRSRTTAAKTRSRTTAAKTRSRTTAAKAQDPRDRAANTQNLRDRAAKAQDHGDHAADQVNQVNERLVASGKRVGNLYLDSYERFVESATSYQVKAAEGLHNETIRSIVATQVGLTRQLTSVYTSAARELIA